MKLILLILLFILITASCKQQNGYFSCDPILNKYVFPHQTDLELITFKDLTNSDLAFQQAVFRSFDVAKKREIWLQKIQILLDKQNYTEAEYAHVASLLNHLQDEYFAIAINATEANERKQFASDWISKAKITLGWSEKQIAFVVYRLYTNQVQFDAEINAIQVNVKESIDPNGYCTCNTSSSFCSNLA